MKMSATAIGSEGSILDVEDRVQFRAQPLLWLAIGLAVSLFSTGWGWNLALAAWIAPVFLLRFSRTSRPAIAIGVLAIVSFLQIAWMGLESATNLFTSPVLTLLTFILAAIFVVPYALDRLFVARLNSIGRLLLFPAAAAAIEFIVGAVLPGGTSMGMRAFTQSNDLALVQIISLTGPYAIGFLIACCATVINHIWENPTPGTAVRWGGKFLVVLALIVLFGEVRLAIASWGSVGQTVKVAGITPTIAPRLDASRMVRMANFPPTAADQAAVSRPQMKALYTSVQDELLANTRIAAKTGAKIVVWSETAAPVLETDKSALLDKVAAVAREDGVYIDAAIGVPFERNETYLIAPSGAEQWHYRKNHPVPGLEPVAPFKNDAPVIETPFGRLSNVICFDGDFPALTRVRSDIMLIPAWDWSEIAYSHTMNLARLRAIENGYSLIRIDFEGVSAAFDPYGRVLAMQDTLPGQSHMMIVDLPTRRVTTLYNRIGDIFAWLCIAMVLTLTGSALLDGSLNTKIPRYRLSS
jgi:apolipoprotein N-acyltransferase